MPAATVTNSPENGNNFTSSRRTIKRLGLRTPLVFVVLIGLFGNACQTSDLLTIEIAEPIATPSSESLNRVSTWQPWEWRGWETFPSLYFAAEADGFMEPEQMAKVSRFSLAILEFRSGQFVAEESSGEWADGDLAGFMNQQADAIRAAHPDAPPILTYRSAMWAGSMYTRQWEALQDQSQFLQEAQLCDGFIVYPKDINETGLTTDLQYCRWDFRQNTAQDTYGSLVHQAALDTNAGVFFDNAQSVVCDDTGHLSSMSDQERLELSQASTDLYQEVFADLVANGKYPILSTTNSFSDIGIQVPWENTCPEGEEVIIGALDGIPFARNNEFWMWNLGDLARNQILNSIRETELGIPVVVHMPWFSLDGGCFEGCVQANGSSKTFASKDEFLEFGIAAFLVSMGPGSYFGFSDMQNDSEGGGWFDASWDYHSQYDEIVTGPPLGPAEISDDQMTFTREFANGTVWVNVADGTYALDLN